MSPEPITNEVEQAVARMRAVGPLQFECEVILTQHRDPYAQHWWIMARVFVWATNLPLDQHKLHEFVSAPKMLSELTQEAVDEFRSKCLAYAREHHAEFKSIHQPSDQTLIP